MIITLASPSPNILNAGMDPLACLNEDIIMRIVALLNLSTLACCVSVSKPWKNLLQKDVVWVDIAKILKLKNTNGHFAACTQKLQSLLTNVYAAKTIKSLLQTPNPNRSAHIINIAPRTSVAVPHNAIKAYKRKPKPACSVFEKANKNTEKTQNKDKIKEGFNSMLVLLKLGLGSEETLHELANVLLNHFNEGYAWTKLAKMKVDTNEIEKALEIVDQHLHNMNFNQEGVYGYIIKNMCKRKQYLEAIQFFKDTCNICYVNTQTFKSHLIFEGCLKDRQFAQAEQYIDQILSDKITTYQHLHQLVQNLVCEKQSGEANRLIGKYYDPKKTFQDAEEAKIWISIFVLAGELTQAASIAKEWQRQDEASLPHYKKCLKKYGYAGEAKKS